MNCVFLHTTALSAILSCTSSSLAADLAGTLQQSARDVVSHCKANEIRTVGVLKFMLERDGKLSDNVGPINTLLAKRLELALVMANDPRDPLNLIEDASHKAKQIPGASHLSREGRAKLFSANYPLMWGNAEVKADAFVTGIGQFSSDLRTMKFALLLATGKDNQLAPLGKEYVANVTPEILSESGESFSTRGAFDGGQIVKNDAIPDDLPDGDFDVNTETVLTSAKAIRDNATGKHPLTDPASPVQLKVRYDGQPIPFEIRDGRAFLAEPNEGHRVELSITKDTSSQRYGVVVKVNGQNTLGKQQRPDLQCGKWILSTPSETVLIRGYQISDSEVETFRVLSRPASKAREIDYGSDVGTLSITVFTEGEPPTLELDEDARESDVIESTQLPKEPSATFGALKAKLLSDANRGLIAEGNRRAGQVRIEKFHVNSTPIMTGTATYYNK